MIFNRIKKRTHLAEFKTTRTPINNGVSHYLPYGLLTADADTSFCTGGRNSGKSTGWVTHAMVADAVLNNECFIFTRNKHDEITQSKAQAYFDAVRFQDLECLSYYTDVFVNRNKDVFIRAFDDNGELITEKYIGFCCSIERAISYKSENRSKKGTHTKMYIEEFGNLENMDADTYLYRYKHLVSTFERFYKGFKVIGIQNKIDRNNAFFTAYNIPAPDNKFPLDTIRTYKIMSDPAEYDVNGNQTFSIVAVENVENLGEPSNVLIGAGLQQGISDNEYEESTQPLISDTRNREIIYKCYLVEDTLKFIMLLVVNSKGHCYWEISHTQKDIPADARVITNITTTSPLHTKGLIPLSNREKKAFEYLIDGKVFFRNNLCGTEFKRALERI